MFELNGIELGDKVKVVKAFWGDEKLFFGKIGTVILINCNNKSVAIDFGEVIGDVTWHCNVLPRRTGRYFSVNDIEKVYGDLVTELL